MGGGGWGRGVAGDLTAGYQSSTSAVDMQLTDRLRSSRPVTFGSCSVVEQLRKSFVNRDELCASDFGLSAKTRM